jgi:SAM-dependent methyltransferase
MTRAAPGFKDYFSEDAAAYAAFRPGYPPAMFAWLATLPNARGAAWDAGTGSGQAAIALAEYFERVEATDLSGRQIDHAMPHPRVTYRSAPATESGLSAGEVDLVTAAQALHWFDHEAFFREVHRVLAPGGAIAVWCYQLTRITPAIDRVVKRLYGEVLDRWWARERRLVEEGYRSIPFPFRELSAPDFAMTAQWTLPTFVGYLSTWSAVRRCRAETGIDPIEAVAGDLAAAWGDADLERTITWPLAIRAGVPSSPKR